MGDKQNGGQTNCCVDECRLSYGCHALMSTLRTPKQKLSPMALFLGSEWMPEQSPGNVRDEGAGSVGLWV